MSAPLKRMPALFIPHGGGPMPLLNEPNHAGLVKFLSAIGSKIPRPTAILVVSAHWLEDSVTLQTAQNPSLYYDYYGFPKEAYSVTYPAPGATSIVGKISELLKKNGVKFAENNKRGYDHGMFVPLKLMYPKGDIPCMQISLLNSLDPQAHIELGQALAPLRDEGVLILGSGMSFHNMRLFQNDRAKTPALEFDRWLGDTITQSDISKRNRELAAWEKAPSARLCHPVGGEEHLLPLHVIAGSGGKGTRVYNDELLGTRVSGFLFE